MKDRQVASKRKDHIQEKERSWNSINPYPIHYAAMILRRDPKGGICPALGMVVNPFGANIILPREMLAGMMSAKAAQARQAAEKQKK